MSYPQGPMDPNAPPPGYPQDPQNYQYQTPPAYPPGPAPGGSKKGCLIAAGVGVGLLVLLGAAVAVIIAIAWMATQPARDAVNGFCDQVGKGQIEAAYQSTAKGLQREMDEETFAAEVEALGLTKFASSSWSNVKIENSQGTAEGTITATDGEVVPLTLGLIKEGEVWKVSSITGPKGRLPVSEDPTEDVEEDAVDEENLDQPLKAGEGDELTQEQVAALVHEAVAKLGAAINSKDFKTFHAYLSKTLRDQATVADVEENFKFFVENQIDLGTFKDAPVTFDEDPAIDDDEILVAKGYLQAPDLRLLFETKFIQENKKWKVIGINIETKATGDESGASESGASDQEMSAVEAKKLAEESILELGRSVKSKNFKTFYAYIAKTFQKQTTAQKLQDAFKSLIDMKDLDLGIIKDVDPTLTAPPRRDDSGVTRFEGSYPTNPKVKFKLGYILEDGDWKLIAIDVNVRLELNK